jgi:hypothetical protein
MLWIKYDEPFYPDSTNRNTFINGLWINKWSQHFQAGDTLIFYLTPNHTTSNIKKQKSHEKHCLLFIVFFPLLAYSQNGVTFKVEELKKPAKCLNSTSYDHVLKSMILSDANLLSDEIKQGGADYAYNIVAQNRCTDSLVSLGGNAFFNGVFQAYSDHRPFVLSPDVIWLLISQGFAQHVNNNSEALRHDFVNFDDKISLVVNNNSVSLDNPNSPWEDIIPEFTKQIGSVVGNELVNTLTCDFSTTTEASKVASQIAVMDAVKSYFEYKVLFVSCGIPEITLEGTPEDWKNIYKNKPFEKISIRLVG